MSAALMKKIMNPQLMKTLDDIIVNRYTDPNRLLQIELFIFKRYGPRILGFVFLVMVVLLAKHVTVYVSINDNNSTNKTMYLFDIIIEAVIAVLCLAGGLVLHVNR